LGNAVDEVVIVLVGERLVGSRNAFHVNALAVFHGSPLRRRERPGHLVIEAPRPAVLVVDGYPEVPMHWVVGTWRYHRECRNDPLRHSPIIVAILRISAGTDQKTASTFNHLKNGLAIIEIILIALRSPEERIVIEFT
jgi:hypothetical protein